MSCLVADVLYFHPGKVVRDLETLKMSFATMETNFELSVKQLTFFQMSVNRKGEKLTVSCRKTAKILAVNRKWHHPIETLLCTKKSPCHE